MKMTESQFVEFVGRMDSVLLDLFTKAEFLDQDMDAFGQALLYVYNPSCLKYLRNKALHLDEAAAGVEAR